MTTKGGNNLFDCLCVCVSNMAASMSVNYQQLLVVCTSSYVIIYISNISPPHMWAPHSCLHWSRSKLSTSPARLRVTKLRICRRKSTDTVRTPGFRGLSQINHRKKTYRLRIVPTLFEFSHINGIFLHILIENSYIDRNSCIAWAPPAVHWCPPLSGWCAQARKSKHGYLQ